MPASGACLGGALPSVGTCRRNPLSSHTRKQWSLASYASRDIFPDSLPASCGALAPSGCLHTANPSPLPGIWPLKPELQLPAPPAPAGEQTTLSGWWVLVSTNSLWGNLSTLPSAPLLLHSPPWLWSFPSAHPCLHQWRGFLVCGNFSSFTAPSQRCRSHPYSFVSVFSFFFCPTQVCGDFLAFWKSQVFCQHSVGVL